MTWRRTVSSAAYGVGLLTAYGLGRIAGRLRGGGSTPTARHGEDRPSAAGCTATTTRSARGSSRGTSSTRCAESTGSARAAATSTPTPPSAAPTPTSARYAAGPPGSVADAEHWHEALNGAAEGLIGSGFDMAAAEVYSASSYLLDYIDGMRHAE